MHVNRFPRTSILSALVALAVLAVPVVASAAGGTGATPTIRVTHLSALTGLAATYFTAVACTGPGDCVAAGEAHVPTAGSPNPKAFTEREVGGRWQLGTLVSGPVLSGALDVVVTGLSCPKTGRCVLVGSYSATNQSTRHPFVQYQHGASWGPAQALPIHSPASSLSQSAQADVRSISCPGVDQCTIGGIVRVGGGAHDAFTQVQEHASWGEAHLVKSPRGTQPSVAGPSVSCPEPSSCTLVTTFNNRATNQTQSTVMVLEKNGVWGKGQAIGSPRRSGIGLSAISCWSTGNCVGIGTLARTNGFPMPMSQTEAHGKWATPQILSSSHAMEYLMSVSCSARGICAIAAGRLGSAGFTPILYQAPHGVWRSVLEPSTMGTLGGLSGVSCWQSTCTAVGEAISTTSSVPAVVVVG
ncbi:MAG: hypothetical protein HKL85_11005 [Acidimicrobiaceae bacterium]|nr:hypothetical protein [Acidimicrobiaceae bacterium]